MKERMASDNFDDFNDRAYSRAESVYIEDIDLDGEEVDGAYVRWNRPPPFPENLKTALTQLAPPKIEILFKAPKCPPRPPKMIRDPSCLPRKVSTPMKYDKKGIPLPPKSAKALPPVPDHEEMLF